MRTPWVVALVPACLLAACLGGEWARVRTQDSPAAYLRFLREHPDSSHTATARERLAYLQLRARPDLAELDAFRRDFPESAHLAELGALVETTVFEAARRKGTDAAYEAYLARFPDGVHAARARGNAVYLRERGFAERPDALAGFVERHADSDFVAEARRSLALPALAQGTRLARVGLRVEMHPSHSGGERLAALLRQYAERAWEEGGLPLVTIPPGADPPPGLDGILTLHHEEHPVESGFESGHVVPPGVLARITVTLTRSGDPEPIWSEVFAFRDSHGERRNGDSILFGVRGPVFWSGFFVPVARWRTDAVRRGGASLPGDAEDADLRGGRALALFSDGRFQVLDLTDPADPRRVAEYRRPRDLARFDGVRDLIGQAAVFGEGGLELVSLAEAEPRRLRHWERDRIGRVRSVQALAGDLFVASSHGLLRLPSEGEGRPEPLFPYAVRDLAVDGSQLAFADAATLYLTTPDDLRRGRRPARQRLGRGFEPHVVRLGGGIAVVVGALGVASFDVTRPEAPRPLARATRRATGEVRDAAVLGGRVFLLGERGLAVFDPREGRVIESVDVDARSRLGVWGRHLVALGPDALRVVDATPWLWDALPASPPP